MHDYFITVKFFCNGVEGLANIIKSTSYELSKGYMVTFLESIKQDMDKINPDIDVSSVAILSFTKLPKEKIEYNVITLCGSTRFKEYFIREYERLSMEGNIVLTVNCFTHADDLDISDEEKEMFDDMHMKKIDMSYEIRVINPGGYIGSSTKKEIEYARSKGMKITYMEDIE